MHRGALLIGCSVVISCLGLDLSAQVGDGDIARFRVINRPVSQVNLLVEGTRRGLRVGAAPGEGIVLQSAEFSRGAIECDIRGKDIPQQSFIGIAFHGVDDSTYESVYFRPFNFQSPDSTRHAHAVQYESLPENGWQRLRTDHPGAYEQPVNPAPDPNGWFHIRIVVSDTSVSVF